MGGTYGEMSVVVPDGWTAEISAVDDGKLRLKLIGNGFTESLNLEHIR